MKTLHDPVAMIQKDLDGWATPFVELDCFGTDNAERIAEMVEKFCRANLDSSIRGYFFYGSSVGCTQGLGLEDGRDVVVKVRPPAHTNPDLNLDAAALERVCDVMKWLAEKGFPCPKPILGPTPLGNGLATVEEMLEAGRRGSGFEPMRRKTIASTLAELIALLRSYDGDVSGLKHFQRRAALYPQPHSKLFDFEKTAAGAEWIDALAARARRMEAHDGPPVLGHADWRVEHLRFQADRIVAAYDWDSLALRPETESLGISAHAFTADWTQQGERRIPTANDIRAYVADYEVARGAAFTKQERRSIFATCVYSIAYGARCAHALEPEKRVWEDDTWPYLLRTEGEALLKGDSIFASVYK